MRWLSSGVGSRRHLVRAGWVRRARRRTTLLQAAIDPPSNSFAVRTHKAAAFVLGGGGGEVRSHVNTQQQSFLSVLVLARISGCT